MKTINFFNRMKMDIDSLSQYYMEKRAENFENNVPLKGIKLRKNIHGLPLALVKLDRKLSKETVTVLRNNSIKTDRPKIFASTHIGGNDIQRVFEGIKEHAYLFLGDPKGVYKDVSGLLIFLNGTINFETNNKQDRKIAKARSVELLNNGGNLLIFPEGAWNITPNLLVMDLYKGTVQMARETGADIIPLAIEQYDNKFYVSIGENIIMEEHKDLSIDELNELLRNSMAIEKFNIFEKHYEKRENITTTPREFAQKIVDKCPYGFTIEDVEKTRYHDKDKVILEQPYGLIKK